MQRLSLVVVALFLLSYRVSTAQVPSPNTGAPFTAIETSTSSIHGVVIVRTASIARRFNGSGYWRLLKKTTNGVDDPKPSHPTATMYDSQKHLLIQFDLTANLYQTSHQLRQPMRPPALLASGEFLPERPLSGNLHTPSAFHNRNLGVRKIEGLDAVGTVDDKDDGSYFETWISPKLSLTLQSTSHINSPASQTEISISQIQLGEPNPTLFQIPPGFAEAQNGQLSPKP